MCQVVDNAFFFFFNKENQILYFYPAVETNDRVGLNCTLIANVSNVQEFKSSCTKLMYKI